MQREERALLLRLARESLGRAVSTGTDAIELPEAARAPPTAALAEERGAFVSLHTHDGGIRGCVGCMSAARPLAQVVSEMACAAALRDHRFPPMEASELDDVEIEISVLSPAEPVRSIDDVEIGRDGLLVVGAGRRGVLLPQVAEERGWDARTFAAHTCMKAGLPPDATERGSAELFRFHAEVFSERDVFSAPS